MSITAGPARRSPTVCVVTGGERQDEETKPGLAEGCTGSLRHKKDRNQSLLQPVNILLMFGKSRIHSTRGGKVRTSTVGRKQRKYHKLCPSGVSVLWQMDGQFLTCISYRAVSVFPLSYSDLSPSGLRNNPESPECSRFAYKITCHLQHKTHAPYLFLQQRAKSLHCSMLERQVALG